MNIALTPSGDLRLITEDSKYSIDIPATLPGLKMIVSILRARERGEVKLATPGAPTQFDIDRAKQKWYDDQKYKKFGNIDYSQMELDL